MRRHTCCGVCFFFFFCETLHILCVQCMFLPRWNSAMPLAKKKEPTMHQHEAPHQNAVRFFFSFSDYIFCYLHVPKSRRQPCATLDPTLQLVFRHIRSASFKQTLVFTQQYTPEHSLQLQPSFIFLSRVTAPTIHVSPHRPHLLRQQQSVEHPQLLTPPHARSFSPPHPS